MPRAFSRIKDGDIEGAINDILDVASDAGVMFGIPVANAKRIASILVYWIQAISNKAA